MVVLGAVQWTFSEFLLAADDLSAFAHLHPLADDDRSFDVLLPPFPAGDYRIYGDIVFESGFAQTLTNHVRIPRRVSTAATLSRGATATRDPDDSWAELPPFGSAERDRAWLASGRTVIWDRGGDPVVADREMTLRFRVADVDGAAAVLEPYMGMLSHAVVLRDDGSVFIHLHPDGQHQPGGTDAV